MVRSRVKITVLKRVDPSVIFDGEVPNLPGTDEKYGICTFYEDGQEFIVELNDAIGMPEGFCTWAWRDIFKDLSVLRFGGNFDPWVEKGVAITCCTDGIRPVSFKMERIEDSAMTSSRATRKMEENPPMIAYCGLDCAECEAYIATQNNDFEALTELAKRWGENHDTSYRPEDIECGGCQSDRLNEYCNRCGVRECGVSHGFETCAECQDYPCDKLGQEWKSWNMADWTKAKAALDEKSSKRD